MKRRGIFIAVGILAGIIAAVTMDSAARAQQKLGSADIDRMITELSNWGRWGKEDQLGTLHLITPQKRREAAALVKEGVAVSLAHESNKNTELDNPDPYRHTMNSTGADPNAQWAADTVSVQYHGYQHTHMDSLCHIFYKGKMYNGFSQQEVTALGAGKLAITNLKEGLFTRGVLVDLPALKGVPYLDGAVAIYPSDLDAWEKRAGVKIGPGDAVFIYTGRWARRAAKGPWDAEKGTAGLHVSCARWLKQRDIAILGSDAASDVLPSGVEGVSHPVHLLMLHAMGVHIFDNCDLEALSAAAAKRKRWTFLLSAAPLPIKGGTGSPLNPIATF